MRVSKIQTREAKTEITSFLGISAFLMIAGFVFGYLFPNHFRAALTPSLHQLAEIVQKTQSVHSWLFTFWTIFYHNLLAALLVVTLGFFLGIFPALQVWTNGVMMGFFISVGSAGAHIPAWKVILLGIAPHGILELPAFVWAAGLGIANGFSVIRWIQRSLFKGSLAKAASGASRTRATGASVASPLANALQRTIRSLPYIAGLLFVAAIIESTVTPELLKWGIHSM
jgi:stage II sporulation protein M